MLSKVFSTRKGQQVWPQRTICEVHRELYDLVRTLDLTEEQQASLIPVLEEAYLLGIKLVKVLIERKLALPEWAENNLAAARELRQARIALEKTLEVGTDLQPA